MSLSPAAGAEDPKLLGIPAENATDMIERSLSLFSS